MFILNSCCEGNRNARRAHVLDRVNQVMTSAIQDIKSKFFRASITKSIKSCSGCKNSLITRATAKNMIESRCVPSDTAADTYSPVATISYSHNTSALTRSCRIRPRRSTLSAIKSTDFTLRSPQRSSKNSENPVLTVCHSSVPQQRSQ